MRTTDYVGTDKDGRLLALLNNTSIDELEHIRKRFAEKNLRIAGVSSNRDLPGKAGKAKQENNMQNTR